MNDADPKQNFNITLLGIPVTIEAVTGCVLPVRSPSEGEKVETDALKPEQPTHFVVPIDALSSIAVFLFQLRRVPQLAPSAEKHLSLIANKVTMDPEPMPRIIIPGVRR